MTIRRDDFGAHFNWGVAMAAYQIEGAYNTDGKGPSIWDIFSNTKGRIPFGQTGNIACDYVRRFRHDLILMSSLHIPNYRFSLSWSRIFPTGTGRVNKAGADFYDRLIDFCLELGIEPWITLYHWDLPQELEQKGGWNNRDIINWFGDYTAWCARRFGDRVKHWMVLNEPMVFTGAGYFLGIHAPGKKGVRNFLSAAHHAALCQAEGGRILKSLRGDCRVGTTFSCSHIEPETDRPEDRIAARKMDALLNRMYIEPLLGLSYPTDDLKVLQRMEPHIKAGDEARLAFDMDFIGVQNYTREIVRHSYFIPFLNAQIIRADKRLVPTTTMNWEVYPDSIYHVLKKFAAYLNMPELIVTENGAAFPDTVTDGAVQDNERIAYLQQYLAATHKAKKEGVRVTGYFIWSFLDNFEWAEGYYPRFGLVHVDFKTQRRIVKASGHWYSRFLNGLQASQDQTAATTVAYLK